MISLGHGWKRLEGGSKQGLDDETRPLLLKLVFFNFVRLVSKICVKIKYLKVPIIILIQQGALVIRFRSLVPFTLIQFWAVALVPQCAVLVKNCFKRIESRGVPNDRRKWADHNPVFRICQNLVLFEKIQKMFAPNLQKVPFCYWNF